MSHMFASAGKNATTWSIGTLTRKSVTVNGKTYIAWDTSKVTNMDHMFFNAGKNANYSLDLRSWQVPLVASHDNFNTGVETKITPPTWVQ